MQRGLDGNCLDICFFVSFAKWYVISDPNRHYCRSPISGVIDVIKQLNIDVITLQKVSWMQVTAGHSCIINRSNSLIFAFNQRLFHWIIFWSMVDQFQFVFCLWSVFVWLVCWFLIFGLLCPLFLGSRICFVSSLIFIFVFDRSVCLIEDFSLDLYLLPRIPLENMLYLCL